MATYPSFGILRESSEEWLDDIIEDRTVSGVLKTRAFYSGKKRRFNVKHLLTSTEFATFESFYGTNRVLPFYFVWVDGATYTVLIGSNRPRISWRGARVYVDIVLTQQ